MDDSMEIEIPERGFLGPVVNINDLLSLPYDDQIIKRVVDRIKENNCIEVKEDTLGILFEELIKEEERKDFGQFYTPQEIVDYIVGYLNIKPTSKILDPTCGCGVFLVTAYNRLKKLNDNALNNIYGVDLNESATKITRINLWLRNRRDKKSLNRLEKNIQIGNYLVENKKMDKKALKIRDAFKQVIDAGGFDYIIGNPPYITLKDNRDYSSKESIFSHITNGNANAASLVVAKSFELLKYEGIMAFVLPKTVLRVESYAKLRKYLVENTKILHIFDLGHAFDGVRGEQIILFLQKTKNKKELLKHNILIKIAIDKKKANDQIEEFYVPQETFKRCGHFLIFKDHRYYELLEKIDGIPLMNISEIFRGIGAYSKLYLESSNNRMAVLRGRDISKFSHDLNCYAKSDSTSVNQSKLNKMKTKKIILQNIFSSESGMISSYDPKGVYTLDTVTNIVLNDNKLDYHYLLGLLNSKLLNFYLICAVYGGSKLTMHTDRIYVGKLPIKIVNKRIQNSVAHIVEKMRKTNNKKPFLTQIDQIVYDLYEISKTDQQLIDAALSEKMSAKSLW